MFIVGAHNCLKRVHTVVASAFTFVFIQCEETERYEETSYWNATQQPPAHEQDKRISGKVTHVVAPAKKYLSCKMHSFQTENMTRKAYSGMAMTRRALGATKSCYQRGIMHNVMLM